MTIVFCALPPLGRTLVGSLEVGQSLLHQDVTKNATHRPLRIALQLLMLILFFMLLWHTFLLRIFELLKLGVWLVW